MTTIQLSDAELIHVKMKMSGLYKPSLRLAMVFCMMIFIVRFFDMSASDNDGLWCSFEPDFKTTDIRLDCFLDEPTGELDEWYASQSDLHVQTVSIDPWTEEIRATLVVIDSGADISVMPLEFAFMGTNCSVAEDVVVQDASGNDMGKHGMREIELDVVDTHGNTVQFKDRFLISDVRQPILAVGKLLRRGWSIIHADQEPQLCNPDNTSHAECVEQFAG